MPAAARGLSAVETSTCTVTGGLPGWPRARPGGVGGDPARALEHAVVDGLRHPPCLVSFSGGHDSTLVLTAAANAARRHGLDLPIPVTWRFVGAPKADEDDAQDEVVRALSLPDWERLVAEDDLDFVGPVAQEVLGRHGILHPVNAYLHAPLLARARGGSLLTGVGGDQLLESRRRLRRPYRPPRFPWLHASRERLHRRRIWWENATEPRDLQRRLAWQTSRRRLIIGCESLEMLAGDVSARVLHPLLDQRFVSAVAARGVTPERAGGRAGLFRELFGAAFPDFMYRRRPKASFAEVFWRAPTREAIARWDGRGVDAAAVDLDALRDEWAKPSPSARTAMLVQQAWLAQ